MEPTLPDSVLELPPGRLLASLVNEEVVLFVRETHWRLRSFPPQCPCELKLLTWETPTAVAVVLLLRLARNDVTTYEHWIDVATQPGLRLMQALGAQQEVTVRLVTDRVARSIQIPNDIWHDASLVVNMAHSRREWPPDAFHSAQVHICRLYPTVSHLWRSNL